MFSCLLMFQFSNPELVKLLLLNVLCCISQAECALGSSCWELQIRNCQCEGDEGYLVLDPRAVCAVPAPPAVHHLGTWLQSEQVRKTCLSSLLWRIKNNWWNVCWIGKKAMLSQNLIWRISLMMEYKCDKFLLLTAFDWEISYARIFWTFQDKLEKSGLDEFTDSAGLSLVT